MNYLLLPYSSPDRVQAARAADQANQRLAAAIMAARLAEAELAAAQNAADAAAGALLRAGT